MKRLLLCALLALPSWGATLTYTVSPVTFAIGTETVTIPFQSATLTVDRSQPNRWTAMTPITVDWSGTPSYDPTRFYNVATGSAPGSISFVFDDEEGHVFSVTDPILWDALSEIRVDVLHLYPEGTIWRDRTVQMQGLERYYGMPGIGILLLYPTAWGDYEATGQALSEASITWYVEPIPEPSTVATALGGFAVLLALRLRRRR